MGLRYKSFLAQERCEEDTSNGSRKISVYS